jgi:hypothetical protein
VAIVAALSVLAILTAPMLALLSASALERLIARNLVEGAQALFVAEAGIEWAFTVLVDTGDWSVAIPGPDDAPTILVVPAGLIPWGTATVTLRRDEPPDGADGAVIVTSTGTVNAGRRSVEVVVRRPATSAPGAAEGPATAAEGVFGRHAVVDWRER